jgi:stage II sporulation protein D
LEAFSLDNNRLVICLSLLFLFNCAGKTVVQREIAYPSIDRPVVKVKLLESDKDIFITPLPGDSYLIRCFQREEEISTFHTSSEIFISPKLNGISLIDNKMAVSVTGLSRISLSPADTGSFLQLNGKPYRGRLEISVLTHDCEGGHSPHLMVLNIIYVEDYLRGVVPAEIGTLRESEIEALKAQAIAARTYALSKLGQYEELGYDLESTIEDQVYHGVDGEFPTVDEAIKATEGMVLMEGERPINAYYHGNCGGETEFIERIWDKFPESYLIPVEDNHCGWAKNHYWEETWNRVDLEKNLSAYLDTLVAFPEGGFGDLIDINIKGRSPSGRVEVLVITTEFATYEIRKDKIRWAMRRGNNPSLILRSTLFDLEIVRGEGDSIERVVARGNGTGHGVGMCQTGAIGRARNNLSFREILAHYYRGVELRLWGE